MIIWFLLAIPILSAGFLLWKYHKYVTWQEILGQLAIAFILVFLSKTFADKYMTDDVEYWGGIVEVANYYEPWNEYIHQTCTSTDSKGNVTTYDCSYVSYHSAYWTVDLVDGRTVQISQNLYNKLVDKFGNSSFVDLGRNYHTQDGDKYISKWGGDEINYHFIATKEIYENRVQASTSVFNFPEVSEEDIKRYNLYDYPDMVDNDIPTILGNYKDNVIVERKLKWLNGKYGPTKEIRLWILLFDNQPREAADMQEFLWKGGNKNEFVICIGRDKEGKVTWVNPFTWSERKTMEIEIRDLISEQKELDLISILPNLEEQIKTNWVRKEFSDFNYITVEPPLWAILTAFGIQLLFNIGYGFWAVMNDIY